MNNINLKQQIISEIQRISKEQNLSIITRATFRRFSRISEWKLLQEFNSYSEAIKAAGFETGKKDKKLSDEELFNGLLEFCEQFKSIPNMIRYNRFGKYSPSPYQKRWGSWNNALAKFKEWLKENKPDSKFIELLPEKIVKKSIVNNQERDNLGEFVWKRKKSIIYGQPIDFRGLRHEPVNEQGVVFLFGKISEELGFSIEAIRTGYPDCNGKRLVDQNKNLWEPVSIEFEYCSSNFVQHGHNPAKCDVIICWIHDWPSCPLEVIELREVIKKLKK